MHERKSHRPLGQVSTRWSLIFQAHAPVGDSAAAARHAVDFTLKTRTDTRLYAANVGDFLAGLVRAFPLASPTVGAGGQRGRLIALDLSTRRYVPFHLSDMLMFGFREDMQSYWSRTELGPDIVLEHPRRFGDYLRDPIPEVLLCQDYLRRTGYLGPASIAAWWRLLGNRFIVVDRPMLEFFWPKYNYGDDHRMSLEDARRNLALVSYRDWLNLAVYGKSPEVELEELADGQMNDLVPAA